MTSIEVLVSRLQPALHDRAVALLAREIDHGAPAHARWCMTQLQAALDRSATLSHALYAARASPPDYVGASADNLRYVIMDLKIDASFDEEAAVAAASQIRTLNQELSAYLKESWVRRRTAR